MRPKGLDVSSWQKTIDWPAVANEGIAFAYAQATQGLDTPDESFDVNYPAISAAGILRGAYHFFSFRTDPAQQAAQFLARLAGTLQPGDLPPMLDLEDTYWDPAKSKDQVVAAITTWVQAVEAQLGVQPIIYTSPNFWNEKLKSPDGFHDYLLWLADYDGGADPSLMPNGWAAWTFWQYNPKGTVNGIPVFVDASWFNGTLDDLQSLAIPPN